MYLKPFCQWMARSWLLVVLMAGLSLSTAARMEAVEPQVATGWEFTAYLAPDGRVWTWGDNTYGQLGLGDTSDRLVPTVVPGLSNVAAIATGYYHVLALKADGTVWAWGYNGYGQTGQGTSGGNQLTPIQVPLGGVTMGSIACGGHHCLALSTPGGNLYAWGLNSSGQVGNGNNTSPVTSPASIGSFSYRVIAGGGAHSLAIGVNGQAYAWGDDGSGQLGDDALFVDKWTPTLVAGSLSGVTDVVSIAAGYSHSISCRADTTTHTWGSDTSGQLGNGAITGAQALPASLGYSGQKVVAGYSHSIIIYPGGYIYAFGDNGQGQCQNDPGGTATFASPVGLGWLTPRQASVVGGLSRHVMLVQPNGSLMAWGDNDQGQLGLGSTSAYQFAAVYPAAQWSLDVFIRISAGNAHSLGLKADGTVWAWGSDTYGQLGDDATLANQSAPVQVSGLPAIADICAGSYHSLALTVAYGQVYTWGRDDNGQLGNDSTLQNSPTPVYAGLTYMKGLAGGAYHSLAVDIFGGDVRAWGGNGSGQLGNGNYTQQPTPVTVSGLTNILSVDCGWQHSVALTGSGTIKTWGADSYGQLGNDATLSASNIPVDVPASSPLTSMIDVGAGQNHSVAARTSGFTRTWGADYSGQLGDGGTNTNQPTPVITSSPLTIKRVSAGGDFADFNLLLNQDGTVYSCGADSNGQLGNDATLANQLSLVQVAGLSNICAIAAGDYHGLALRVDGTLYAWGSNGIGQLGLGTSGTNEPVPVTVTTYTWKPTIAVSIPDAAASESGANPGTFSLTRSAVNAGAVTVAYALSGGALNGTDYATLSGTAVIPANVASVNVTVTPIDDPDDEDSESVDVGVTSGGEYRVGSPSTGSLTITDDDTSGFTVSALSANTQEADAATITARTFTVVLNTRPTGNVVLLFASSNSSEGLVDTISSAGNQSGNLVTFNSLNWNAPQTVQVFGQNDDFDDGDISYSIQISTYSTTADPRYLVLDPPDVSVLNLDNDTAGVIVDATVSDVTEAGSSRTFSIRLASRPYAPVSFTLSSGDPTEGILQGGSSAVTIQPADWSTGAAITVVGVDDAIDDGNQAFTIQINKSSCPGDPAYNNLGGWDVNGSCLDDDAKGVTLSATTATATEGSVTGSFTIRLNSEPVGTATVVVAFTPDAQVQVDTDAGTAGFQTTVTFTTANWGTAQTVTVSAVDDPDIEGTHSGSITGLVQVGSGDYSSGVSIPTVTCTVSDNDSAGLTVVPTTTLLSRQLTTEAGGTATFGVRLNSRPPSGQTVTLRLNSNDITEGRVGGTPVLYSSSNTDGTVERITFPAATDLSMVTVGMLVNILPGTTNGGVQTSVTAFSNGATKSIDVAANLATTATAESVRLFPAPPTTVTGTSASASATPQQFQFSDSTDLSQVQVGDSLAVEGSTVNAGNFFQVTAIDNLAPGKSISVTAYSGSTITATPVAESLRVAHPIFLTFGNGDWNVDQAVTVTGIDDLVNDNDLNYGITFAVDTSLATRYVAYDTVSQANQYMKNQDNDVPGVQIVQSLGTTLVNEADLTSTGQDTFTVQLNTDPGGVAFVNLTTDGQANVDKTTLVFTSSGGTIWSTPQTVTVTAVNDSIDESSPHDATITFSISSYAGAPTPDPVVCQVTDNDAAGITVAPTSGLGTTEAGGTTSFLVVLASQPTANVVLPIASSNIAEGTVSAAALTFTAANWMTPQSVTVTGVDDQIDDGNMFYTVAVSADTTTADLAYRNLEPSDVAISNVDNDAIGVSIVQSGGTTAISEAGVTDTYTVVLASQPTSAVTVTLLPDSQITVLPNTLTFNPTGPNLWSTAQTVTVTAVNDNIAEGTHSTSIAHSASGGGYSGLAIASVTATITDNDTAGATVSAAAVTTTEAGGSGTFTVVLNTQPTANVTVVLSSSDATEGTVAPSSLTFTPGDFSVAKTATVTGLDDSVDDGDIVYTAGFSLISADPAYNNLPITAKSVTNTDNDTVGFTISTISNNLGEDGTSGRFTVRLTSQPTASVSIGISSSDAGEGSVSATSLTFDASNWNEQQEVTVYGLDDDLNDGDVSFSVILSADTTTADTSGYLNLNPADVAVMTLDDDQAGVITSAPSVVTMENGAVTSFSVQLLSEPTASVTIPISIVATDEATVAPASLVFTSSNWNVPQTATVTPVDDFLVDGDQPFVVVLGAATSTDTTGYNAIDPTDVTGTTQDDDSASFTITGAVTDTSETGTSIGFDIVLASQPTANVTVTVSGLDSTEGSLSASVLTFTPSGAGAWNIAQTLTVTGVNDDVDDGDGDYILTLTPGGGDATYAALPAQTLDITNLDDDAAGVTIGESGGTTVVAEIGVTDTYTIQLDTQPLTTATVTVTPDSQILVNGSASPVVLTFDPAQASPAANGWNTVRTITVSAAVDTFDEANPHAATITHAVANYVNELSAAVTAASVAVTVNDNDPPQVITNTGTSIGRASNQTLTTAMFAATDDDTAAASLTVTVVLAPGQGDLWIDYGLGTANLLINGETFPQSDIIGNRLSYRHSGSSNATDGIAFRFSDAVGNQGPLTIFNIAVTGFIPPSITLNGAYSPTYTEDDPLVAVDTGPAVSDPDSVYYSLLTIDLDLPTADDELSFAVGGNISIASSTISHMGTPIGTFSGGVGTTPLTVTFLANTAGDAQLTDLLAALRFRNTSQDPVDGVRTVRLVLRDDSATENVAETKALTVLAVNDPPTIAAFTLITPKNVAASSNLTVGDVDNYPLLLDVTVPPGKGALSGVLDISTQTTLASALSSRAFTYTPTIGQEGTDSFTVRVTDPDGATATAIITVLITGGAAARPWMVSDPPVETEAGSPLSYNIVVDFSELAIPPTMASQVTYTLLGTLPSGVTFGGFTPSGTNASLTLTIGPAATGVIEAGIVVTETASNTSGYQPITIAIVPAGALSN